MIQSVLILDSTTRVVLNRVSHDPDKPNDITLPSGQILSPRHDGDIGWTLTEDLQWIDPHPPVPWPQQDRVRFTRDNLLSDSDIYMISDYPISETVREQWRQYRQQLRDIPQQSGFPNSVIWPVKPS